MPKEQTLGTDSKIIMCITLENVMSNVPNEQGVCPVCNGENLEYGSSDIEGDVMGYEWTCEDCGSEGMEWYDITFNSNHGGYDLTFSNHNVTHNTKE